MKFNIILTARFGNVLFEVEAAHHIKQHYGIDVSLYALVNDMSSNPYAYKRQCFIDIKNSMLKLGFNDEIKEIESFDQFEKKSIINLSNYPFDYVSIDQLKDYAQHINANELCLIGYFQNKKYIKDVHPILPIDENCTIGIHVRCGDYLQLTNIFPNLQTTPYFINALDYINRIISTISNNKPTIKVFSDEIDKVNLQLFNGYDVHLIENKSYFDDFCEFASCAFKILSNSTFAYQASILADSKIICAPPQWNNTFLHSPYEVYAKLYRNDFKMIQYALT